MESLKPILLLVVLGGVGYGVYVALNHAPPPEPSPVDSPWNKSVGADPAAPPGSNGNATTSVTLPATSATGNPWQGSPMTNGNAVNAAPAANGGLPMAGSSENPVSSGVGNLPFGIGGGAAQPAAVATPGFATGTPAVGSLTTNATPESGQPPMQNAVLPTNSMPPPMNGNPGAQIPALMGGTNSNTAPGAGPVNTDMRPGDAMPSLGTPNTGAANSAQPALGMPNQAMSAPAAGVTAGTNPTTDAQARHDYDASKRAVLTYLNRGQLVEALRELSRWYDQPIVPAEDQPHLVELLGQLAGTVIYSRDGWLAPPYEVRAGDTLESIAQQYQVPWQLLAKINGLSNSSVMPGEKLKIIRGPFHAQLNVQQGWLALFADGLYAGRFRIQMTGPLAKPDGDYPVAKFAAGQMGASASGAPFISLGGDLHLRVPEDVLPPGVNAVRINRQDLDDVFDMLSERSQVTIHR